MTIKYKLGDLSKDFGIVNKDTITMLGSFGDGKKHTTNLTDDELNYFFDQITKQNMVESFEAFLGPMVVTVTPPKPEAQQQSTEQPVLQTASSTAPQRTPQQEAKQKRRLL